MNSFELLAVLIVGLVAVSQATDYCSKTICPSGVKHIACNNNGSFASSCPADRKLVTLTQELKDAILKCHNDMRNDLGLGKTANLSTATRMATMQWDDELATIAELNVKRCQFAYDGCRNTDAHPNAGQNIAKLMTNGPFTTGDKENVCSLVSAWAAEKKDTTKADIKSYPAAPKAVIAHFTMMAMDSNNAVGCGVATYKDGPTYNYHMACNYGKTTAAVNGQTYAACESACKTGANPS